MEPADLNENELDYELRIRGIPVLGDKRAGTKALRIDINNEIKGLKPAPVTSPLLSKLNLLPLERVITGLANEAKGAVERNDENAKKYLTSRLVHYFGKVKRLEGTDADEVSRIEKLHEKVDSLIISLTKRQVKNVTVAIAKDIVDREAVPKLSNVGAQRPEVMLLDIANDETEEAAGGQNVNNNMRRQTNEEVNQHATTENSVPLNSRRDSANGSRNLDGNLRQPEREFLNRARELELGNDPANLFPNPYAQTNRLTENPHARNTIGVRDFDQIVSNPQQASRVSGYRFAPSTFEPREPNGNISVNPNLYPSANSRTSGHFNNFDQSRRPQPNNHGNNWNVNRGQTNFRNRRNPVAEWNVFFSGDNKVISLNDFLSQVALLARAERLSDDDLLTSAVYLFKGAAYTWYRAFYPYYNSWAQLVAGLKEQFLPCDYDFWLLKELEQRRQGESENFGIYFAAMEMMFRNLSYNLSEQQRLAMVMRNMSPVYAERLALENIRTLAELSFKCKKIEEVRYRISRQVLPQIQRRDLLEPAFSYSHPPPTRFRVAEIEALECNEPEYVEIAAIDSAAPRLKLCYNCGEAGHRFNQCSSERKLFCYKCGAPNCTVNSCRRCQSRSQGNGLANSRQGESLNSQRYLN